MPSPPLQYRLPGHQNQLVLIELAETIHQADAKRQEAYDLSRQIQVALVQARESLQNGATNTADDIAEKLHSVWKDQIPPKADRTPREANLSFRMEDFVRVLCYQYFLQTGQLMPQPDNCTDEEYLGGCMGVAQDLQRYGMGRATVRDVESVQAACDLMSDLQDYLLTIDFRNGPLRRKYDGTKYALKALETLLYELAVTGDHSTAVLPAAKRTKRESSLLPVSDLQELKARMEHRDELREALIKKCRDGQKAAKQSIFALHRGDKDRALQLLQQCKDGILQQLLPIVQEEPPLRKGSFGNVLEEYVEAKLFAVWLYGRNLEGDLADDNPSGLVLQPTDFDEIVLEPEEYLGGLCDLTGEVGRYAVQRGTARDVNGVKLCLQTNSDIQTACQMIDRLPGGIGKKMDALRRSVEKLERMLYELSLSEAAGGRNVHSDMDVEDNIKQE